MHLPDPPLPACGLRSSGSQIGMPMLLQRKVTIDKLQAIAELFIELLEDQVIGATGRTLKVAVFNQHHLGPTFTLYPILRRDLDARWDNRNPACRRDRKST